MILSKFLFLYALRSVAALATYFIVGAVVLKLKLNGTGLEMIPNKQFWKELPFLVKVCIEHTAVALCALLIVYNTGWLCVCIKLPRLCWPKSSSSVQRCTWILTHLKTKFPKNSLVNSFQFI